MHNEKKVKTASGWGMLFLSLALLVVSVVMFIRAISQEDLTILFASLALMFVGILLMAGLFVINPNEAAALLLFGAYKGTTRDNGLRWANPFLKKMKVSLRARNLNGDRLKVNDLTGNPIEIAAVVVWKVVDTAEALIEVDNYHE